MVIRGLLFALWLAAAPAPRRVVSTAPSITEMLYALGLGDRVVGVTTFCHYPPEAARKPKVGNYLRPDVETILSLRPDLVIAERTGVRHAEKLPGAKIRILEVSDGSIAEIHESIRRIGEAMGVPERAAALSGRIRDTLDGIRRRAAGLPRRRVMFVAGRTPGRIEDLIVAGRGSYLDEVLAVAGCDNIFRDSIASYAKVSLEEVLRRNPEVIIDMGEMAETTGVTEERKRAVIALWNRYASLAAVRRRRVYAVAADFFVVPGPRVVEAARAFAAMAHPEAGF